MVFLLKLPLSWWFLDAWSWQGVLCPEAALFFKRISLTLSPLVLSLRPDGRKQWSVELGSLQGEHLQASNMIPSFNFFSPQENRRQIQVLIFSSKRFVLDLLP